MTTVIRPLKGFRDFLPDVAKQRLWLRDKICQVFRQWGFVPLETPTLEPLELFAGQIGEDEKLFFQFIDNGGRAVALRYDQTVPTCRVLGLWKNKLNFPFKRYQIQPAFRAEKPQRGRYREFIQCDADIFGIKDPIADAEVIALGLAIFEKLGFKQLRVLINDRDSLTNIPYLAIASIDKLKKIGVEGVINDMRQKGISHHLAQQYLDQVQALKPSAKIKVITNYLHSYGFPRDWYDFEPTIARSFSYSSGPIWEIEIPNSVGGSVLGGERFDGLVKKVTGQDLGGTGFGLGFDRTFEACQEFNLIPNLNKNQLIRVVTIDQEAQSYALKISKLIREKTTQSVSTDLQNLKITKKIKQAINDQVSLLVIIGTQEQQSQTLVIKNLQQQTQETLPIKQAINYLDQVKKR